MPDILKASLVTHLKGSERLMSMPTASSDPEVLRNGPGRDLLLWVEGQDGLNAPDRWRSARGF